MEKKSEKVQREHRIYLYAWNYETSYVKLDTVFSKQSEILIHPG